MTRNTIGLGLLIVVGSLWFLVLLDCAAHIIGKVVARYRREKTDGKEE